MRRDPLYDATRAEVAAGRRWVRWSRWWSRRARELKVAATVIASATAIAGAVRVWFVMRWRDVGAPAEQVGGSERMGIDRVDKPKAP